MNYEEFIDAIKRVFEETGLAKVILGKKININGIPDTYIRLIEEDDPAEIDIFLYPYYLKYTYKKYKTTEIMYRLIMEHLERKFSLNVTFESMKEKLNQIIFHVVNYEIYEESLKDRPHIKFFDLAIIFSFYLNNNLRLLPTIPITNEMSAELGFDRDQLFKISYLNTISLFPYQFSKLQRRSKLKKSISSNQREQYPSYTEEISVYLLTNNIQRLGSFHLIYSDIMKKIAEQLRYDFYIIPYSINDLIVIPKTPELTKEILSEIHNDMIFDFGDGEFLSDNIYYFDRDRSEISEVTF